MPRPYPPEFRQRAVALVRAGKQIKQVAYELGISAGCLHNWVRQDRIDRHDVVDAATETFRTALGGVRFRGGSLGRVVRFDARRRTRTAHDGTPLCLVFSVRSASPDFATSPEHGGRKVSRTRVVLGAKG